ncbi:MAG: histidinol-phosphate transaminase [Phycisphaerales bacterium]|nr:MAG: histidinol-phosphate transaminase [Phycisphaerales bacterium]
MGYFRDNVERMAGYTPGFQPTATDVVKLNTNENPYPPSPEVMKVLAAMGPEQLRRYPDPVGNAFRQAAAELHGVEPGNIMCCNGGDDLLSIAIRACCDTSRPLAYPVPTYSLYPVLANLEDCELIEVPFDGQYNLPAKLASTGAALTIVCNPNAPTATFIAIEELASLANVLPGVLLIDEAYVDFAERDAVELVKRFDNVVLLRSLSKGYSLAGLRFGYAIAGTNLIDGLLKVKDSYNVDALSIALATAAIKDQTYFRANVQKVKADRQTLTERLRALGLVVGDSATNFVLARVGARHVSPVPPSAGQIHGQLARRNIFVRYFNVPGLDDKLRISVGTPEQNERLLAALQEILSM